MLREQVITEWTGLKEQITNTFNQLKQQILASNNPEIQHLENEILTKINKISIKQELRRRLNNELVDEEGNNPDKEAQVSALENEIAELNQQKEDLRQKLDQISPLRVELTKSNEKLHQLNYLYSLETSLQERAKENTHYLTRIERAEEKWGLSEQKLEQVRDLLANGLTSKLFDLYKHGKI